MLNNDVLMQISIADRSKEELDELIVKLKTALQGKQLSFGFYHMTIKSVYYTLIRSQKTLLVTKIGGFDVGGFNVIF